VTLNLTYDLDLYEHDLDSFKMNYHVKYRSTVMFRQTDTQTHKQTHTRNRPIALHGH